jgi:hypothetical protein
LAEAAAVFFGLSGTQRRPMVDFAVGCTALWDEPFPRPAFP